MGIRLDVCARFCLRGILIVSLGLSLASCSHQPKSDGKVISKLPFGGVNALVSQQKITGKVDIAGWALSEAGIESVSIYVDRTFVAGCSTGLPRPDVAKAYPNLPDSGVSGWTVTFDSTNLSPSWHELTVQAKSKAGATRDLASLPIVVQR
jgi:large repetitive protein